MLPLIIITNPCIVRVSSKKLFFSTSSHRIIIGGGEPFLPAVLQLFIFLLMQSTTSSLNLKSQTLQASFCTLGTR